jgi:hypothetical protein
MSLEQSTIYGIKQMYNIKVTTQFVNATTQRDILEKKVYEIITLYYTVV